jgi:signal recognition particle GTPase
LPYNTGPEKVIARVKELVAQKKLDGIADVKDLSDRKNGLRLVFEVKSGFNPEAVLAELYRLTPLEESFAMNAVALVDNRPVVADLLTLLRTYVNHRIEVIRRQYQGDAAALCHDAWNSARRRNIEFLLCDTAGRLHTKSNLMQELAKVVRILGKQDQAAPHEKWIVLDATTGSNALVQAREFHKAIGLTGVILTKLDGSGKGGIAIAIQHELGIPTRFIGTGEKETDFAPFDREKFVDSLL